MPNIMNAVIKRFMRRKFNTLGVHKALLTNKCALTCVIYEFLDLLFQPFLVVEPHVFLVLPTITVCLSYRRLKKILKL